MGWFRAPFAPRSPLINHGGAHHERAHHEHAHHERTAICAESTPSSSPSKRGPAWPDVGDADRAGTRAAADKCSLPALQPIARWRPAYARPILVFESADARQARGGVRLGIVDRQRARHVNGVQPLAIPVFPTVRLTAEILRVVHQLMVR